MHEITIGLLFVWLLVAVYNDIRCFRIPNSLVLSGALVGMVLNTFYPLEADTLGLLTSLTGLAVGLVILLPLYLFRVMGAGDVKLMAMIGAFVGPGAMLGVTLYVLIAGGVLAVGFSLLLGRLTQVFDNLKLTLLLGMVRSPQWREPIETAAARADHRLPYGVAIASGTIVYLLTV
jgi:prepilin peptidase CpaA